MRPDVNETLREYAANSARWLLAHRSGVVTEDWLRVTKWASIIECADHIRAFDQGVSLSRRKLEIEGSPSDGYDAWFTDSDGNLNTVVSFADPMEAADWCERNGFAWEVIGLEGDPAQWLADWRAQQ